MSAKNRKGKKFKIPNIDNQLESAINSLSKYRVGEKGISFHSVKKLKPIFAFDYLSLEYSKLCFNSKTNNREDLIGFVEGLKKISSFTYEDMCLNKALRFHKVDLQDERVSLQPKDFLKILAPSSRGITENELPTLYQFDLQYKIKARAVGFLFKGVFYIVWYDKEHTIYQKK